MPITLERLLRESTRPFAERATTLREAAGRGLRTAFLCHSHADGTYVRGLVTMLSKAGWDVYVDWRDPTMPAKPSRETARTLKLRIEQADFFLFLATPNSMSSRWCPWEIGYADGAKSIDTILVIPTSSGGETHGSEYVDLYRRIDIAKEGDLAVWSPPQGPAATWLRSL